MIDGPTPLQIARNPTGWWIRSNEFFTAGEVLLEKKEASNKRYYEEFVGKQITEESKENFRYLQLSTSIIFNFTFSCELLVKAILVKIDPEKWIPDTGSVKFGHDIYDLIVTEIGIELNDLESKIVKRIGEYISYGKYPERAKPGNVQEKHEELFNYHPYVSWCLKEYYEIILSIRGKLNNHFNELTEKNNS